MVVLIPGAAPGRRGPTHAEFEVRRRTRPARGVRVRLPALGGLLFLAAAVSPVSAQAFLTQEEALRLAFPVPATIQRRTAFLDESEIEQAGRLAGADIGSGIVTYYVGFAADAVIGYAYFDVHRVRTLDEVLMVVVTPEATVSRVEVLRFGEPRDYLPPGRWLDQFSGRGLPGDLSAKGAVVPLTGATLTTRAVVDAVRRVLALHQVITSAAPP